MNKRGFFKLLLGASAAAIAKPEMVKPQGIGNVEIGVRAMSANTIGQYNTAVGYEALRATTSTYTTQAISADIFKARI